MKRSTPGSKLPLALLMLLAAAPVTAQEPQSPQPLSAGTIVSDSIAAGATHAFTVALTADQFVYGEVEQRSVDVSLTVRDPHGEVVTRSNSTRRGSEIFHFDAQTAGEYRIELEPTSDSTGSYTIGIHRIEGVATEPAGRVDQLMLRYSGDVPGGVVGVVQNGRLVFSRGYGLADLTHDLPFTPDTRTNIGSTSKQFTGFAVALLDQRGQLSLDDDVRKHIPELPDFGQTVTLRHLLSHTSGYREFFNTLALAGRRFGEGDHADRSEIISVVQRQPELQNAPGEEWNYNNTGYALLAMVVERVTGASFPEWMRDNVFAPLGMENTMVRRTNSQIVEHRARGYTPLPEGGFEESPDLPASMGAGGIYTTVGDLALWLSNLETGAYGGRDLVGAMTTPYVLANGDTTSYGLGIMIDEFRGVRRIQHGGADVAHRSMLAYYPSARTGVVVLSNNADFRGAIHPAVAEVFLGDALEPEPTAEPADRGPFDPENYDPSSFDELAGRYSLDPMPTFVMRFWREGDTLIAQATGQPRITLQPTSDSTFTLVGVPASVTFHREADGDVTHLTLHQNGDHRATRLTADAWSPTTDELQAYTGRFFSRELETFYTTVVEDGKLILRHRRLEDVTLTAGAREDTFSGAFPIQQADFERDTAGRVTAIVVGNGRSRGIRFERVE